MSAEAPRQYDFTGELVDNRTRKQRQTDKQANGWQQGQMFAQREIAQFGVTARPQLPSTTRSGKPLVMALEIQDPRTEEEKQLAQQKAAEEKTYSLFSADGKKEPTQDEGRGTVAELKDQLLALREKRRKILGLLDCNGPTNSDRFQAGIREDICSALG